MEALEKVVMTKEVNLFYEKTMYSTIHKTIMENLEKVAKEIADEYMKNAKVEAVFRNKVSSELKDDTLFVQIKLLKPYK